MRAFKPLVFTLSLVLPFGAAPCADFGPISITVPQGFDGPIGGGKGSAKTAAWIKRHVDGQGGTLLQVTTYDDGPDLRSIGWPGSEITDAMKNAMAAIEAMQVR